MSSTSAVKMTNLTPQERTSSDKDETSTQPSASNSPPRSHNSRNASISTEKLGLPTNPFATPSHSNYPSTLDLHGRMPQYTYFRSRRIKKGSIEKPWLTSHKDTKQKWQTIIPMVGLFLGLALGAYMVYNGWQSIPVHQYCSVYEDDFSSGTLNTKVWTKEAEVGGFGNGQFEETTTTDENVFIKDGMLTIMPTLQDANLINSNSVINLTAQGICSTDIWSDCIAVTNTTNGTIVPPARSARINTKKAATITYGRVEVVAKLPKGDWLWPAIWMLPVNNTYGEWPLSGEIDIAESRGNNHTYPLGGNNVISSTLHWGPDLANDAWWRTYGKASALMTTFSETFHTFGLEWSEKYIYMYLDSRLLQVMYTKFAKPMWQRGDFPLANSNGTAFIDPWSQTGRDSTPFDEPFYLILNVAVGGTNGWFEDGKAGKPWVDGSPTAKLDFWQAKDTWYPTWTDPTMQVKSVKMWQQKGYNGC